VRRILAPLAAAALATTSIAGTAVAAPSQQFTDTQTVLFCEGLTNDAGSVFAFAVESEQFGTFADLGFWAAPTDPQTDAPTWIAGSSLVTFDELSVTVVYELFEFVPGPTPEDPPFGDPVGEATLEATLTPVGDPQPYSFSSHEGNHLFRQTGTIQEYSVSGTLSLPDDITFDLSGCEALRDETRQFSNAPASSVSRFTDFQLNCTWETADGFVFLFATTGEFGTFADIFVTSPAGDVSGFTESATLTESAFDASWELFEQGDEGEPGGPAGTAEASAELSRTNERINDSFSFGNTKVHTTGQLFAVDGTLHLDTTAGVSDLPMDGESCFAADLRTTQHDSARQGPRGKPLANDTPDAAAPLAIGDSVTVGTRGTALEPEAACVGVLDGEPTEFPIGHTAWWTFEGTGDPVTVDTAGSDFDTVVGVYVEEAGELVPIGCVDDTEDGLQAAITVDTTDGVTYFVQAGGFFGDAGTLVLTIS
jgi:hypothetical protein